MTRFRDAFSRKPRPACGTPRPQTALQERRTESLQLAQLPQKRVRWGSEARYSASTPSAELSRSIASVPQTTPSTTGRAMLEFDESNGAGDDRRRPSGSAGDPHPPSHALLVSKTKYRYYE